MSKEFNYKRLTIILLVLLIGIPCILFYTLNKNSAKNDNKQNVNESSTATQNILLLGTDGRDGEENYRSDSMIIATIDLQNKNIKLTSLARDTYVDILIFLFTL